MLENELLKKVENGKRAVYHGLKNNKQEQIEFFEVRKKRKHKKQHYVNSSSEDSESQYYIAKKGNQRKR